MVIPLDSYLKNDRSNFEINVLRSQTFCCTNHLEIWRWIWFSNRGHLVVFHLNLLSHVIADQPLEFRCKLGVEVSLDQICHSYSWPSSLGGVSRSDSFLGRSQHSVLTLRFLQPIHLLVKVEHQVSPVGNKTRKFLALIFFCRNFMEKTTTFFGRS